MTSKKTNGMPLLQMLSMMPTRTAFRINGPLCPVCFLMGTAMSSFTFMTSSQMTIMIRLSELTSSTMRGIPCVIRISTSSASQMSLGYVLSFKDSPSATVLTALSLQPRLDLIAKKTS
ncbi:hypothetical protein Ancab_028960 [Ancistrocladus abbreviatus]